MTIADVDLYDLGYLDRLANPHPEWGPIEVIDGALYVHPAPSELHQRVLARVWAILEAARPTGWRVILDVYVRIGPSRLPRPDLIVYRTGRPIERRAVPETPDLVVEVLSRRRLTGLRPSSPAGSGNRWYRRGAGRSGCRRQRWP